MRISLYLVIRTPDHSEYGWAMVEEYKEDKLAENLDDEERLYRAESEWVGSVRLLQPRARSIPAWLK